MRKVSEQHNIPEYLHGYKINVDAERILTAAILSSNDVISEDTISKSAADLLFSYIDTLIEEKRSITQISPSWNTSAVATTINDRVVMLVNLLLGRDDETVEVSRSALSTLINEVTDIVKLQKDILSRSLQHADCSMATRRLADMIVGLDITLLPFAVFASRTDD